jgi:fused signal recognition particle receptor
MGEWLYLIIGVIVVAVGLTAGLVTTTRRRKTPELSGRRTEVIAPPEAPSDVPVADDLLVEPAAPTTEKPETTASRLVRLRQRLAGAQGGFGRGLLALLSRERLDEDTWESIEDTLLTADVGVAPTQELVDRLRTRLRVGGAEAQDPREVLREELVALVGPDLDRRLQISGADGHPGVVLVVGVNGTGKTTTVGKLARVLVAEDKDVVLGAADTFRAAAADQLETWGARVGVPTIRSDRDGADPAAVAFDAVKAGAEMEADVVLIDTAGRLHNKVGLMDELGKVKRVIEKQSPIDEVLLVLDATTGQNGLRQAEVFAQVVDVTGIVLTKLDGTAKGGVVLGIVDELKVPVRYIGVGERIDDLQPFNASEFAQALFSFDETEEAV